ncbi:MAG: helix-turn-helix domain-containing protein [Caenispirillum sp.]|nr:helix-turn-helix domain-containing protein [Caenispirillum sp.]
MIKPKDIPTSPHERQLWVSMQLKLRGKTLAGLARDNGWGKQTMYFAMRSPSYPQEQVIADALGIAVRDLFPERYDAIGNRIHPIRSKADGDPESNVEGLAAA